MPRFASRSLLPAAVAVVTSLLSVTVVTHASADSASFADGTTTAGSMDIRRVGVVNEQRLTVRVIVDDLQRRAGQGSAQAWLDTDAGRAGPEFTIVTGLWDSDWQIFRARDWRMVGNGPLPCAIDQRLLFDRDTIVWSTGRGCLGRYGKVRVSVTTKGGVETDHSPGWHRFHSWVRRY